MQAPARTASSQLDDHVDIPSSADLSISISSSLPLTSPASSAVTMGHGFAPMKNDLIIRAAKGLYSLENGRDGAYPGHCVR